MKRRQPTPNDLDALESKFLRTGPMAIDSGAVSGFFAQARARLEAGPPLPASSTVNPATICRSPQPKKETTMSAASPRPIPTTTDRARAQKAEADLARTRRGLAALEDLAQRDPAAALAVLVGAAPSTSASDRAALDAAFGTTKPKALIEKRGCVQTFRPMTPEQAREHLAARERGGR